MQLLVHASTLSKLKEHMAEMARPAPDADSLDCNYAPWHAIASSARNSVSSPMQSCMRFGIDFIAKTMSCPWTFQLPFDSFWASRPLAQKWKSATSFDDVQNLLDAMTLLEAVVSARQQHAHPTLVLFPRAGIWGRWPACGHRWHSSCHKMAPAGQSWCV